MMTAASAPVAAEKVVGHEVDEVEVGRRGSKVNMLEDGAGAGKSGGEEPAVLGEVNARSSEKSEEVVALLGIGGIFPADCAWSAKGFKTKARQRHATYCQFHPGQVLR